MLAICHLLSNLIVLRVAADGIVEITEGCAFSRCVWLRGASPVATSSNRRAGASRPAR
jgi:hypothetical protein